MASPSRVLQQRGKPLIARVLEATLVEMARVGYEHLSVEDIAARARVNKTTIYRRWPTLDELALGALESASHREGLPDTGSLEGDLIAYLTGFREVCRTPIVRSLARMQFSGELESKLGGMVKERIHQTQCDALLMFCRAKERGELAPGTDTELLRDLFLGSAQSLLLFQRQELSDEKLKRIVSVILFGAASGTMNMPARRP